MEEEYKDEDIFYGLRISYAIMLIIDGVISLVFILSDNVAALAIFAIPVFIHLKRLYEVRKSNKVLRYRLKGIYNCNNCKRYNKCDDTNKKLITDTYSYKISIVNLLSYSSCDRYKFNNTLSNYFNCRECNYNKACVNTTKYSADVKCYDYKD